MWQASRCCKSIFKATVDCTQVLKGELAGDKNSVPCPPSYFFPYSIFCCLYKKKINMLKQKNSHLKLNGSGLVVIYCPIYCLWNLTVHQSHRAVTPFCCCTTIQIRKVFQIIIFLINRKKQSVWMPMNFPHWKKPCLRRGSVEFCHSCQGHGGAAVGESHGIHCSSSFF